MLLNAAKCQGHSFCLFWVIKGKPAGGGGGGVIRMDGKSKNDVFIQLPRNFGEMKFSRNWKKVYVR